MSIYGLGYVCPQPSHICAGLALIAQAQPSAPEPVSLLLQARYIVYNDSELRDRQRRSLDQVTSVLSVSDGDAVRLLCEYKW